MRFNRGLAVVLAWLGALGLLVPAIAVAASPEPTTPVAPPPVQASIGGQSVWAHFTNPRAHEGRDSTIHDELVRLITTAPAGSTIRGTIYSLTVKPVARALVSAEQRGVNVQILMDGDNETSASPAVAIIKPLSAVRFCTYDAIAYGGPRRAGGGCISTSDDGDLHVKMFTFTQATDPNGALRSDVSWFGSANLTYASGSDQSNNAVTVYGDAALMSGFNTYFSDLWNRRHVRGDDYYDARSRRGYYRSPAATLYASPEGRDQTDTVVSRLNDVTPNRRCQVRIGMSFVTAARPELLTLIKSFTAKGCQVWMAVGSRRGAIRMSRSVYTDLLEAGVSIRRTTAVHDKFFTVYGKFGRHYRYRVYTGSQNWSGSALTSNDEIFVKLAPESGASHPLYDGFRSHFENAWVAGSTCTTSNYPCR